MIESEETKFRYAGSESIMQKMGKSINFINTYQFDTWMFPLNGPYDIVSDPQLSAAGLYIVPTGISLEIFDVAMWNVVAGTSGTTELDVLYTLTSGGSFTSIFTTTPKIAFGAGDNAYVQTGGSGTGLTAPVLTSTPLTIPSGAALRLDKLSSQVGGENAGLTLFFRPVSA